MTKKEKLIILCEGAVTVALALALCPLEYDFGWLQGGGVDILMVPLVIYAMRRGGFCGMAAGATFGLLKSILFGGITWGVPAVLLDYVLAYAVVGVAGFFKKPYTAVPVATAARFLMHFTSGVTIWAITSSQTIFGMSTASPFIYSVLYNGPYMIVNGILCLVIVSVLQKPVSKIPKLN